MFKPENFPQLSPYLTVKDSDKSIEFYHNAFGFTLERAERNDKGKALHTSMRMDDVVIMFAPEGEYGSIKQAPTTMNITMPINMYVYCKDVDALYKQAIANGAKSVMEPHDAFWGDRFCSIIDIDGYEWGFATTNSINTP